MSGSNLRELFESQVEDEHREWAWENGRIIWEQYKASGAAAALRELIVDPIWDASIKKTIELVTFMGKPDLIARTRNGTKIIIDFKVNGYCSERAPSPAPGYITVREAGETNQGKHKRCVLWKEGDIIINIGMTLAEVNIEWARQMGIYDWLVADWVSGEGDSIIGIEQILCGPKRIRVAEHKYKIGKVFQEKLYKDCEEAWEIINSDWFFRDLSEKDSKERCEMLDGIKPIEDDWLREICK